MLKKIVAQLLVMALLVTGIPIGAQAATGDVDANTSVSTTSAATTESKVDFLKADYIKNSNGATAKVVDDQIVFTATEAGQ